MTDFLLLDGLKGPSQIKIPAGFFTPVCLVAACASPLCHFGLLSLWRANGYEFWGCWSFSYPLRPCDDPAKNSPAENVSIDHFRWWEIIRRATITKDQNMDIHLMLDSTCPGLGLVAALLGRARGSDWVMVLSLLARSRGWEWSKGRGSVWELSFRFGTNFGDSKNGTKDITRCRGLVWRYRWICEVWQDEREGENRYIVRIIYLGKSKADRCWEVTFESPCRRNSCQGSLPISESLWFLMISPSSKWPDKTASCKQRRQTEILFVPAGQSYSTNAISLCRQNNKKAKHVPQNSGLFFKTFTWNGVWPCLFFASLFAPLYRRTRTQLSWWFREEKESVNICRRYNSKHYGNNSLIRDLFAILALLYRAEMWSAVFPEAFWEVVSAP